MQYQNFQKQNQPPGPDELPSPEKNGISPHGVRFFWDPNPVPKKHPLKKHPLKGHELKTFRETLTKCGVDCSKLEKVWPNLAPRKTCHSIEMHHTYLWKMQHLKHGAHMTAEAYIKLGLELHDLVERSGMLNTLCFFATTETWLSLSKPIEKYVMMHIFVKRKPVKGKRGKGGKGPLWIYTSFARELSFCFDKNKSFLHYPPSSGLHHVGFPNNKPASVRFV